MKMSLKISKILIENVFSPVMQSYGISEIKNRNYKKKYVTIHDIKNLFFTTE